MSSTGSHKIPMHIHMSMIMALKDVIIEMVLIMVIIFFIVIIIVIIWISHY